MVQFTFSTAGRILFGPGTVAQIAGEAARMGDHVLLVTGSRSDRAAGLRASLDNAGMACTVFRISDEPDVEVVAQGAEMARRRRCNVVIGFGGGSVMDGAKAIAALVSNRRPILDYLEVIGQALSLEHPPAPCIAVPTTAGTGSEVTRNAVIRSAEHHVKVSMRSQSMLPDLAVVDPELTLTLPPDITAATGFDALTQVLEAFVSTRANPLTDGLCREGLVRCARPLKKAYHQGDNVAAREDMAVASLFSGLALANAGLGAVHGIAGPLGGMIKAPHGAVCASLLPAVTRANIAALEKAPGGGYPLERYAEVARLLTGRFKCAAAHAADWLEAAAEEMQIPSLSHWGLTSDAVTELADHALRSSSMQGNPVALNRHTLMGVIHSVMDGGG